ncbi:hypothetical protein F8S13_02805 [Chloroflexia bacterium SDU3-3]|nr:hypothetical protein F8S13_02805 [Chloroflexia bacterium SDU3-3]
MLERPLAAATYIGPGKVRELSALVQDLRADAVVFANPLRGGQRARLESALGVPVVIWYGAELR